MSPSAPSVSPSSPPPSSPLPAWAKEIVALYESHAASQFVLHGNTGDRFAVPGGGGMGGGAGRLGSLAEFVMKALMPQFEVILSYDLGNGIRVERGGEIFSQWPAVRDGAELPKAPKGAIEALTRYFRYCANLARLGKPMVRIGCIVQAAHLVAPSGPAGGSYEVSALALLMREWGEDTLLAESSLATCLLSENLADLHPLLSRSPRAGLVKIPLPGAAELSEAIRAMNYPLALSEFRDDLPGLAGQLTGSTLGAVENLLKLKNYRHEAITPGDVVRVKKEMVEKDCEGLIEFIEPKRTLADVHAQEKLIAWLRQDIVLWRQGDVQALPMGYLICGPVGTGKTYLVECLAGEAGVPVVKLKNFRDKWVGSTEGNLEKIFRLLQGLGKCFVFIDEADQTLGKRDAGSNDAGLSGRIYSMIAQEMSQPANRGRIIWVLASSRPDLIEVDLKRPGRVDVKIPIFPATEPEEAFALLRALCGRRGVKLTDADLPALEGGIPHLLTPGAAEALAVKIYRLTRTKNLSPLDATLEALDGYQNPVPADVMDFQLRLAANEATDVEFIPPSLRKYRESEG